MERRAVMVVLLVAMSTTVEVCSGWDLSGAQFWDRTKETVKGAADHVKDKTGDAVEGAQEKGRSLSDWFSGERKMEEVVAPAPGPKPEVQPYSDLFAEFERHLQETTVPDEALDTRDVFGKAKDGARYAKDKVSEKAGDKAQDAKEMYGNAKDKVSEAASDKAQGAKEKAQYAKDKVSDAASDKAEDAKEMYGKAKDKAQYAKDKVSDAASDKAQGAKEKAQYAKEKVSDAAGDKAEDAKEMYGKAKEKAQDAKEKVSEAAGDKAHDAKEAYGNAKEKVSQAAGDVGAQMRQSKRNDDEL